MAITQKPVYTNLRWGRSPLTEDDAISSFLAVGASGSGKSLVLRCLMQSVLSDVGKGNGTHALVYDPKNDAMSILSSFVDRSCIKLFNPLDARCVCWHTSRDIASPLECNQLAWALVPQNDRSDDFFQRATRSLIRNVAMSFNLSGFDWTLADLLRAVRSNDTCKQILLRHPETEHIVQRYLLEPKLSSDISASVESVCGEYEPLAACFEKAMEKVSIKDCIDKEMVAVLGSYEASREAIQRLNVVLSSIYTFRVLSLPEYTKNRYWQFYDELGEAGPLRHLSSFAKLARSKGGRLVIAFQAIAGLQQSRLFGREGTEDMLSNFGNRFIGRVEDPTTAKWLSDYIGEQDVEQVSRTTSHGKQGSSSVTRSKQNQRTLLPSEFMGISHCGPHTGLTGIFKLRSTDAYWDHIDPQKLFSEMILPKAGDVPGFIECALGNQYLRPWGEEQNRLFLGVTPPDRGKRLKTCHVQTENDELDNDRKIDNETDIDLTDFHP